MVVAKHYLVCLLDKSFPPEHSFVSGFLCRAFPQRTNCRVLCLLSRGSGTARIERYYSGVCLNVLYQRRGWKRFLNLVISLRVLFGLAWRLRRHPTCLFVRNDPLYLFAAWLVRPFFSRLLFQSSFPHELVNPKALKRYGATVLYKTLIPCTDGVLGVAEGAIRRLRGYAKQRPIGVIPLLAEDSLLSEIESCTVRNTNTDTLRLLYIGTHSRIRCLERVYEGCVKAVCNGIPVQLVSIGADKTDAERLRSHPPIKSAFQDGTLQLLGHHRRRDLQRYFVWANLGLCAIPERREYVEASPTKLAEYFSAGLPVLATLGIPLQEKWIRDSGAGYLVSFDPDEIAEGLRWFWLRRERLIELSKSAQRFAEDRLQYSAYVPVLYKLAFCGLGSVEGKEKCVPCCPDRYVLQSDDSVVVENTVSELSASA